MEGQQQWKALYVKQHLASTPAQPSKSTHRRQASKIHALVPTEIVTASDTEPPPSFWQPVRREIELSGEEVELVRDRVRRLPLTEVDRPVVRRDGASGHGPAAEGALVLAPHQPLPDARGAERVLARQLGQQRVGLDLGAAHDALAHKAQVG